MTHKEIIQATWPDHAQRICEECYRQNPDLAEHWLAEGSHETGKEILGWLFIWFKTEEGHDYWRALYCGA
jgi:hypothetical protein